MIMADTTAPAKKRRQIRHWVRRGFLLWALVATLWLANSYPTQGLDSALLESDATVNVANAAATLDLSPLSSKSESALIFICGIGVAAAAYATETGFMAKRLAKGELLQEIGVERSRLDALLEQLTPRQMTQAGATLAGWSVKDILGHLVGWQQLNLDWYSTGLRGEKPQIHAKR
jgi:hypothetical protein